VGTVWGYAEKIRAERTGLYSAISGQISVVSGMSVKLSCGFSPPY